MMRLTLLLAVLAAATPAWGLIALAPLEPTVLSSDLVVVATATRAGKPQQMQVALPGMKAATKRWMRASTLKVTEVILDADGTNARRKTVTVLMMAPGPKAQARPRPGPIALPPGPGRPVRPPIALGRGRRFRMQLKVGSSYVLLLKKMDGRKEFYLAPYPPYIQAATKPVADRIRKIADVDAWPWSKPDAAGLQVALMPSSGYGRGRSGEYYSRNGKVYLTVMIALRNKGKRPIRVDPDPVNKPIQIEALDANAALVQGDPYKNIRVRSRPGHSYAVTLDPGRMRLIGLTGPAAYGVRVQMDLKPGTYKVRTAFAIPRDHGAADDWYGCIRSATATITVKDRPTPTRPPIRLPGVRPAPQVRLKPAVDARN